VRLVDIFFPESLALDSVGPAKPRAAQHVVRRHVAHGSPRIPSETGPADGPMPGLCSLEADLPRPRRTRIFLRFSAGAAESLQLDAMP